MSDEEEVMSGGEEEPKAEEEEEPKSEDEDEEEEEPRAPPRKMAPPEDEGPSEAELAMQKRREQLGNIAGVDEQTMELLELARIEREREEEEIQQLREKRKRRQQVSSGDLDVSAQELLDANKIERAQMEEEIQEMRQRNELRKKERLEEEHALAERRAEEEARRKAEEEERRRKKEEEEADRREQRAAKMAEFEKFKNPPKPNFVISKRDRDQEGEEEEPRDDRKSKEQLEAEKRAILAQRIQPLSIQGFDSGKLSEKAKELHNLIYRLESEKYDLEKRFKEQQYDMMELAERARQMNKVGEKRRMMREGDAREGQKRVQLGQEEIDPIQERFAGAPAKIEMYSKYERQKDKRMYSERHVVFHGPTWLFAPERIKPDKTIEWDENTGLPSYVDMPGGEAPQEEVAAEEEE